MPHGPPVANGSLWSRSFESGVVATWDSDTNTGRIDWPGIPPSPSPPSPSPPPSPGPTCPGPKCPPVPASNYKGCFVDHVHGKCDLPHRPPHSTGHCKPTEAEIEERENVSSNFPRKFPPGGDSVERCNSLCSPLGYKYFGVQAGHACFCGNAYGSMGQAPRESDCSTHCQANSTEICGGPDFNSVYETVKIA